MTSIWSVTTFDFVLLNFLIVSFEDVYKTAITSQLSEIVAYILSGFMFAFLGTKTSLCVSFGMSFCAGLLILFYGLDNQTQRTFLL